MAFWWSYFFTIPKSDEKLRRVTTGGPEKESIIRCSTFFNFLEFIHRITERSHSDKMKITGFRLIVNVWLQFVYKSGTRKKSGRVGIRIGRDLQGCIWNLPCDRMSEFTLTNKQVHDHCPALKLSHDRCDGILNSDGRSTNYFQRHAAQCQSVFLTFRFIWLA